MSFPDSHTLPETSRSTDNTAGRTDAADFYVTGGTLPANAVSYVARQADHDLWDALERREFCYVLNTRQMGKSSLMVRTARRLRQAGVRVAVLDLTALGQNVTPVQWYDGLLSALAEQLHLEDAMEDFWLENAKLGPLQRFITAIRQIALPRVPQPLVIFIDEIDAVRSLPFPVDELFAAIRECYNRRRLDSEYEKLTFCLLGVAAPTDLIRDTRISPFNIGRRIALTDFTSQEAAPLAAGLPGGKKMLDRVLFWTNGHPYMTQRLCRSIVEEPSEVTAGQVDALCERLFLTKQARDTDDNLAFVRNRLLRSEVDVAALLDLYLQVRRGRRVRDDEMNPLCGVLRLSGAAKASRGVLRVRNRIYDHVFDPEWVRAHMPDAELRRQRDAYRRGLLRAATVAAVVVLLMGLLAGEAFHQGGVARAAVRAFKREARRADRSEAEARAEAAAARREAQVAMAANGQAQAQKQIALHQTELAKQQAKIAQRQTQYAKEQSANAARQSAKAQRQTRLAQTNEQEAVRQRGRASTAAQQATTQAKIARDKAQEAFQQRNLADQQKTFAQHTQQVADLQLAGQTWESEDGSAGSVEDLLNQSQRSGRNAGAEPGTERFEWRLLWEKLRRGSAVTTHTTQGRYASIAVTREGNLLSINEQKQLCDTPASDGPRSDTPALDGSDSEEAATTVRPLPDAATLSSVSLSPDGTQVAIGRANGRLDLYAEDTLQRTASWQISQTPISSLAFEPDGRMVQAWDGQALVEKSLSTDGPGERKPRQEVFQDVPNSALHLVSPAMHYIAWMNTPTNAYITLRNLSKKDGTGFLTRVLAGHTSSIRCLQFSPDASQVASGDDNGNVLLWDTATGARLHSWNALSVPIQTLGFSADSNRLAAGGGNGLIRIWNIGRVGAGSSEMQTAAVTLKGHTRGVSDLIFSADGHWLASADAGGDGRIWPLDGAQRPPSGSGLGGGVETIAFAPDSQTFACTFWERGAGLSLYDGRGLPSTTLLPPRDLPGGPAEMQSVAFSPDRRTAAVAGTVSVGTSGAGKPEMMRYFLQFWDPRTGHTGARWESPPLSADLSLPNQRLEPMCGGLRRLAFSPDGRTVAGGFGGSYYYHINGYDQVVKLWDTASGRELRMLTGFRNSVNAICFSPDGRMLVVGCRDRIVRCFDTRTWAESRRLTDSSPVTSAAYSPDGHTLAVGDEKGLIYLTNTARWQTHTMMAHSAMVADLAFSPDGQTLASASWDHTVKLWDVASGRQTQTVRANDWVHRVAFSPDGTRLAYGGSVDPVRVLQAASAGQAAAWQRQEGAEEAWTPAIRWKDMTAERIFQSIQAARLLTDIASRRVPGYARPNPSDNLLTPRYGHVRWHPWLAKDAGAQADLKVHDDNSFTVRIAAITGTNWQVQVNQNQLALVPNRRYLLQFRARADRDRVIGLWTQNDIAPHDLNGLAETLDVTTKWQAFRLRFMVGAAAPGNSQMAFLLGQAVGTVQIADVVLVPADAPPGERRASAGAKTRTVSLSGIGRPGTPRWVDPVEAQRQASALLGEVERHQAPLQNLSFQASDQLRLPDGRSRLFLGLPPEMKDAAQMRVGTDGAAAIHINRLGAQDWSIEAKVNGLPLKKGGRYVLQFRARADAPQTISVSSQQDVAPQDQNGLEEGLPLTPQWRAFRLPFQVGLDVLPNHGEIIFDIGQRVNTLQLADLLLISEKATVGTRPMEIERPPAPVQNPTGVLHLAAADAVTHGVVRYESGGDRDNLGYWDDPTDWVEWPVQIAAPGSFRVTAEVTASGSGLFTVTADGRSVMGRAPNRDNYSDFQSIDLGTLTITQTGRVWISVHPVAEGWKWMNLKSLTLVSERKKP